MTRTYALSKTPFSPSYLLFSPQELWLHYRRPRSLRASIYDSPSTVKVPDDLQAALDANPAAKAFFATLNGANRYAILYRIQTAVKPETRARRIADFVAMLKRREMLHP